METDLSAPITECSNYLDSDDEGEENREHNCERFYSHPWKENAHTLKNVFERLAPKIKETRDRLGPFMFTRKTSKDLEFVLMKNCIGEWYFGQWNRETGIIEGVGVAVSPCLIYEGYLRNGNCEGKGREICDDGGYYEGDWINNYKEGRGLYVYADGTSYNGEWKNDKRHGLAVVTYPYGNILEATYFEGKLVSGVLKDQNGVVLREYMGCKRIRTYKAIIYKESEKYEGEIVNGDYNGFGVCTYNNGDKYEGEWTDNKFEGYGRYTHSNGVIKEGQWKNGQLNGNGTYLSPNGDLYVGQFKDGKRCGQGTMTYANGEVYVGEWKDDMRDGQGSFEFNDGAKYVGDWVEDIISGNGTYYYSDGIIYSGESRNGNMNGKGIMIWPDGQELSGDWREGILEGFFTLILHDKSKHYGRIVKKLNNKGENVIVFKCVKHDKCMREITI